MWVARRDACIRLPRRSRVPRCPLGIQPDLQDCRATCDSTRQGWMMLGQGKGEKGEKRSEGKGEEGGEKWIVPGGLGYRIRPVDRATFYPKVLRAAYATLECNRYRDQCFDLRTATRSYGGWIFIRNAGERERERTVSPRESSFIVRDGRDSVPREREREYKVRFVRDCTRTYFEFRLEFRFVHFETETVIPLFQRISYYIASSWEKINT